MPYSLQNRNVLVTAGSRYRTVTPHQIQIRMATANTASLSLSFIRGLGALVAQKFAAQGSNVAINYFSSAGAAETIASDIRAQYNVKVITIKGVRSPSIWRARAVAVIVRLIQVLARCRMRVSRPIVRIWFRLQLNNLEDWMSSFRMLLVTRDEDFIKTCAN